MEEKKLYTMVYLDDSVYRECVDFKNQTLANCLSHLGLKEFVFPTSPAHFEKICSKLALLYENEYQEPFGIQEDQTKTDFVLSEIEKNPSIQQMLNFMRELGKEISLLPDQKGYVTFTKEKFLYILYITFMEMKSNRWTEYIDDMQRNADSESPDPNEKLTEAFEDGKNPITTFIGEEDIQQVLQKALYRKDLFLAVEKLYEKLEKKGYYKEIGPSEESFTQNAVKHLVYASTCAAFISTNKKLCYKAKAIFDFLQFSTKVFYYANDISSLERSLVELLPSEEGTS